jgi:hypothetical protein
MVPLPLGVLSAAPMPGGGGYSKNKTRCQTFVYNTDSVAQDHHGRNDLSAEAQVHVSNSSGENHLFLADLYVPRYA